MQTTHFQSNIDIICSQCWNEDIKEFRNSILGRWPRAEACDLIQLIIYLALHLHLNKSIEPT